jgi:Zn-dependent protease with chaperone function
LTLAGPVDRDNFFAAQRRHRRAALVLTALAAVAVVLMSVPLAAIVFPLLFGIVALLSLLVGAAIGTPSVLDLILATGGHYAEGDNAIFEAIVLGLIIVLPGALLLLAIWHRSLRLLGSIEPARLAELYGARLLRKGDFEERQVANIVEELAIAAGIPAPAVRIVESKAVNAAAVVPDAEGALVLVTRGLLDRCDRSETQALLGSVVSMIANADARAAFRWMGVAAAVNIAADLLHGPLAPDARARLRTLLPLLRSGTLAETGEGARAVDLLLGPPPSVPDDPARGRIQTALVFPFLIASAMFNLVALLANYLFVSPALALLMRRRRYLADATAVQLTRDPESLARGLHQTVMTPVAEGWPLARFSPVFLAAPTGVSGDLPIGQSFGTHPSIGARYTRVIRMTSLPVPESSILTSLRAMSGWRAGVAVSLSVVVVALMVILVPLMLYAMIAVTMLSLMAGMMWVMIALMPIHWLLG